MWFKREFTTFFSGIITLVFVYKAIAILVKKKLRATLTALADIPLLGLPRQDGKKLAGNVVICGGSIAGLLTARVCSDHFENVIIIEPEEWVATAEGMKDCHRQGPGSPPCQRRSRVPQYAALHAYQVFSALALRKLFPDFDAEVQRCGGRILPANLNIHWAGSPIPAPLHRFTRDTFPTVMFLSRPAYETTLRRLVLSACPNVRYVTGTVTGVVRQESGENVVGSVRVRSCHGSNTLLSATLVIDCTGAALGGFRWLEDFYGSDKGEKDSLSLKSLKTTYDHKTAHTTCEFDVPERLMAPLKTLGFPDDSDITGYQYVNFPDPNLDRRNLAVGLHENNFLQLLCGGWDVHERMSSIGDMKTFLSQMVTTRPIPEWVLRMLDLFDAEQVPVTFKYVRCPPSVYIQYHRAKQLPSNFIAIGDSVLQLNPIRGQGCTKACVEAVTLNALLSRCVLVPGDGGQRAPDPLPEDFSRTFFRLQARRTGTFWDMHKTEDYAWSSTTPVKGDDPLTTGAWKRAYGYRLNQLLLHDRDVAAVWWQVINWLAPTSELFAPNILTKVAWMQLRGLMGL